MPHLDPGASSGDGVPGPVRPRDYAGPGGEAWRHAGGGCSGEGRTVLSALVRIAESAFARERERPFAGTELAAPWRAFARTASAWRDERTGPYGVAVVANMFAIAAWREPEDYADLLVLAERHGLHRLALVQHHLSTRVEGDQRLLLGSRFCHGLAPTHYGELPDELRTTCARVGMRFMLAGAHEVEPGPDIETPGEFLRHFLDDGLPEWRAQIARYAEDPWSPYARQLNALADEAGLPGLDVTIGRFMTEMRDHTESRDREMVAREIRRLVAESGLSQREFASRLGTSPSRMSSYCTGQVTPSAALLLRIRRLARAVSPARPD